MRRISIRPPRPSRQAGRTRSGGPQSGRSARWGRAKDTPNGTPMPAAHGVVTTVGSSNISAAASKNGRGADGSQPVVRRSELNSVHAAARTRRGPRGDPDDAQHGWRNRLPRTRGRRRAGCRRARKPRRRSSTLRPKRRAGATMEASTRPPPSPTSAAEHAAPGRLGAEDPAGPALPSLLEGRPRPQPMKSRNDGERPTSPLRSHRPIWRKPARGARSAQLQAPPPEGENVRLRPSAWGARDRTSTCLRCRRAPPLCMGRKRQAGDVLFAQVEMPDEHLVVGRDGDEVRRFDGRPDVPLGPDGRIVLHRERLPDKLRH